MKIVLPSLLASVSFLTIGATHAFAQATYSGNQSTGFGGALGQSTLSITDNATTGVVNFSLAATGSISDVAFFFSTGSGGVTDTTSVPDSGDEGRRAITGESTSPVQQTPVYFATGFSAKYAVAIDNAQHDNLFQLVPGQSYLSYVSAASNITQTGGTGSAVTYGFSLTEAQLGIAPGGSFSFVATLSNAQDGTNNIYRSDETIGASNVDGQGLSGNLGNTGTLTYSGFDTYTTSVPEPTTWLGALLVVALLGRFYVLRPRRTTGSI